jgi:hypothetical protein
MVPLIQKFRDFWHAATGQSTLGDPGQSEVVVHDPGSQRPHDLDNPFFDHSVQSRMAAVIADNASKTK